MSETATARTSSETRQRQHVIRFRADDAELAAITAGAARAGMSVGSFLRRQAIGTAGPRAVRQPPVDRAALAIVLAALGRFGSNLNQIARVANATGEIDRWGDLHEATAAAQDMRRALMRALGRGD